MNSTYGVLQLRFPTIPKSKNSNQSDEWSLSWVRSEWGLSNRVRGVSVVTILVVILDIMQFWNFFCHSGPKQICWVYWKLQGKNHVSKTIWDLELAATDPPPPAVLATARDRLQTNLLGHQNFLWCQDLCTRFSCGAEIFPKILMPRSLHQKFPVVPRSSRRLF